MDFRQVFILSHHNILTFFNINSAKLKFGGFLPEYGKNKVNKWLVLARKKCTAPTGDFAYLSSENTDFTL